MHYCCQSMKECCDQKIINKVIELIIKYSNGELTFIENI